MQALPSHEPLMLTELVRPAVQQTLRRLGHAVRAQLTEGSQWRRDEAQLRQERKGAWEQELRAVLQQLEAEAALELHTTEYTTSLGMGLGDDDGGDAFAAGGDVDGLVHQLAAKRQAALLLEQSQKLEALVFNAEVRLYASVRLTRVFDADADAWHGARRLEVLQTTAEVKKELSDDTPPVHQRAQLVSAAVLGDAAMQPSSSIWASAGALRRASVRDGSPPPPSPLLRLRRDSKAVGGGGLKQFAGGSKAGRRRSSLSVRVPVPLSPAGDEEVRGLELRLGPI